MLANDIVDPYLGALEPVFDSLVFLGPTEAAVSYQVGSSYHWEIGCVILIDGHWRVALGTMCRDLMDAAYTCDDVTSTHGPDRSAEGLIRAEWGATVGTGRSTVGR